MNHLEALTIDCDYKCESCASLATEIVNEWKMKFVLPLITALVLGFMAIASAQVTTPQADAGNVDSSVEGDEVVTVTEAGEDASPISTETTSASSGLQTTLALVAAFLLAQCS